MVDCAVHFDAHAHLGAVGLMGLDRHVAEVVDRHRSALASLRRGAARCALDDPWLDPERVAEIEEIDDPLARAIAAWLRALSEERRSWPQRVQASERWRERHQTKEHDAPVSLEELRLAILLDPDPRRAADHGEAFDRAAQRLAGETLTHWVALLEHSITRLSVHRLEADTPRLAAARLLDATDALAAEALSSDLAAHRPTDVLRSGLGREASEGWPARLNHRWLEDLFSPAGWLDGRRPRRVPLPRRLGATSFARALGSLGAALLEASRPTSLPFSLHQHPRGLRRHRRYATFASLAGSESFARHALGLGRERAREQRRRVARAMLATLRVDALRVVCEAEAALGEKMVRERFAELAQPVLGAAPRGWLTTLPAWRPADARALMGSLLGADDAQHLVERFEVDWFSNPAAAEALRAADAIGFEDAPLPYCQLSALVDRLVERLERAIG